MDSSKKIQESFKKLHEQIKHSKEISEEDVRVAFVNCAKYLILSWNPWTIYSAP